MPLGKQFPHTILSGSLISIFMLMAFLMLPIYTEEDQSSDNCCKRIDKEHASLYIQYERTGVLDNGRNKETVVWLRLRNNTTCPVLFQTIRNYHRLVNGKIDNAVQDGQEVEVYYEIEIETARQLHYQQDFFTMFRLLPGRSIMFSVPGKYFIRKSTITVPFRYTWEESTAIGLNPRYEVRYTRSELPPGWEDDKTS